MSNLTMNKYLFLCTICCLIISVLSNLQTILDREPCSTNDNKCFTSFTRLMYKTLVNGDEDLGIKSIDPSFVEKIDGNLPLLKYTLYNSTLYGFKDCEIQQASMLPEKQKLKFDILCAEFHMSGAYEVNGTLMILPVNGKGDYTVDAKMYKILMDTEILTYEGEDGKSYVALKNTKLEPELQGSLDFNMTNLFGGNKDLSERFLHFAKRRWKLVAKQLQNPPLSAFLNLLIDNFNTLLKHVPLESIVND